MVLKKLFGKKDEDTAAEDTESKEKDDPVIAVAGTLPELDAKMAEVINENVEASVEQKTKRGTQRGRGEKENG